MSQLLPALRSKRSRTVAEYCHDEISDRVDKAGEASWGTWKQWVEVIDWMWYVQYLTIRHPSYRSLKSPSA